MQKVWEGFNESLFRKLAPPFPKVELLRFDGCRKGDEVHLVLHFPFLKQTWNALIIENGASENEIYFIDIGSKCPFFLKSWQHKHIIRKVDNDKSLIIDQVEFSTGSLVSDLLFFPILYTQFLYRKPIYKNVFAKTS